MTHNNEFHIMSTIRETPQTCSNMMMALALIESEVRVAEGHQASLTAYFVCQHIIQ